MNASIPKFSTLTPPAPTAAHEPFSWVNPELKYDLHAQFAAMTVDICEGIETCLTLVRSSSLQHDFNRDATEGNKSLPTLNQNDTDRLLRMAMASARLLSTVALDDLDHMNDRAARAAR